MFHYIRTRCQYALVLPIVICLLAITSSASAQTAIIRVDGPNGSTTPAGQGNGWGTNAYKFLQDALVRADFLIDNVLATDVQVWVRGSSTGGGVKYVPGTTQSSFFNMVKKASVYGGFDTQETGTTAQQFAQRDPEVNITILTADISGNDSPGTESTYSDNCYTVVTFPNQLSDEIDTETVLDGFTIRGARNTSSGGGILCSNAGPLIRGCLITDNRAAFEGGGLFHQFGSSPVLRNCVISNNRAGTDGGGVHCTSDTLILNCSVEGNRAQRGGGLYNGGAGGFKVVSSKITGNIADATGQTAAAEGGGIYMHSASLATVEITSCLIASNQVLDDDFPSGGGIASKKIAARISNCTIVNNVAAGVEEDFSYGGGASIENPNGKVENSIVWGNVAEFDPGLSVFSGVKVNYSDIQGGWSGATDCPGSPPTCNINSDPSFTSPGSGIYQLACGSPCINTGGDGLVPADVENVDEDLSMIEPTPDRDLKYRRLDVVDMGAYEKQAGSGCPGDLFPVPCGDSQINIDDLLLLIGTWSMNTDCSSLPCDGNANGDNVVNIDDLLLVIGTWGSCSALAGVPTTVQDCMNICSQASTIEEYQGCMNKCLIAIGENP